MVSNNIVKTQRVDRTTKVVIFTFAIFAIVALLVMFSYILKEAFPAFRKYGLFHMYFTAEFTQEGGYGIWGPLTVTLISSMLATALAVPLALRTAFFIHYRMKHGKSLAKIFVNILAGVPSVIFGVFALYSLKNFTNLFWDVKLATTLMNSVFMLMFMIIPTMVSLILNQLKTIPQAKFNAVLGLGNTKTHAMYTVAKKEIKAGIYIAIITALGRAIGETMAMSFILAQIPNDYFENGFFNLFKEGFMPLGVYISKFFITDGNASKDYLFAAGLALFIIVMILVSIVTSLSKKKTMSIVDPWQRIKGHLEQDQKINRAAAIAWISILPFSYIKFGILKFMASFRIGWAYMKSWIFYPLYMMMYRKKTPRETYSDYFAYNRRSFRGSKLQDVYRITIETLAMAIVIGFSLWISLDVLLTGVKAWTPEDWTWSNWNETHTRKVASSIANPLLWTLLFVFITIVVAFPFALLTAIYLSEYAAQKKRGKVIKFFLDSLGGTPSIIFGIFGSLFFVKTLHMASNMQFSLIAGSMTMLLVILPTFTRSIEQVLQRVPQAIRDASYALGASKTKTIFTIVVPRSISGIAAGVVLSAGRIVAETAPVYLTLGSVIMNTSVELTGPGHTLTTEILGLFWTSNGSTIADLMKPAYKLGAAAILLSASFAIIGEMIEPIVKKIRILKNLKRRKAA